MAEISAFEWSIALRAAADRALRADEDEFDGLCPEEGEGGSPMPRALVRAERREKMRKNPARRAIIRSAAGVAAAALIFSASVAASPVTTKLREIIVNRFEEYFRIYSAPGEDEFVDMIPSNIPENFYVIDELISPGFIAISWDDGAGGYIDYTATDDPENGFMIDSGAIIEDITHAVLFGEETEIKVYVHSDKRLVFIWQYKGGLYHLESNRLTVQEMIEVVENLR